jgi:predicted hydrolase (HD superfamily)
MGNYPSRDDAIKLLHEYTKSDSLRRHAYGVEQAMRKMAEKYNGDPDEWGLTGLMHDFDYEMYPSMEDHPARGNVILKEKDILSRLQKRLWGMPPIAVFLGIQIWQKHYLL